MTKGPTELDAKLVRYVKLYVQTWSVWGHSMKLRLAWFSQERTKLKTLIYLIRSVFTFYLLFLIYVWYNLVHCTLLLWFQSKISRLYFNSSYGGVRFLKSKMLKCSLPSKRMVYEFATQKVNLRDRGHTYKNYTRFNNIRFYYITNWWLQRKPLDKKITS
jgi:hypothetical protein